MLTHFSICQQGQRHIEKNTVCQDYCASTRFHLDSLNGDVIVAAVADGVGSCDFSQYGSETAVRSFLRCIEHNLIHKIPEMTDESVTKLLEHAFHYACSEVEREADRRELPFMEFDSTLTGVVYDGQNLWFGHIGDDGAVVLYSDGTYEMITKRHKGEEAHSLYPLREERLWQFGKANKEVVSCVLMTDGVLDYCVDSKVMGNRVFFPFLEPALTNPADTDEEAETQRSDWAEYLEGKGDYPENFRESVTDDISFVVIQNPEKIRNLPPIDFDLDKWEADTKKRKEELDEALYAEYRAYKVGKYRQKIRTPDAPYRHDNTGAEDAVDEETQAPGDASSVCAAGEKAHAELPPSQGDSSSMDKTQEGAEGVAFPAPTMSHPDAQETDGNERPVLEELCSDAVENIIGVFKIAQSMGRYFRNQIKPKGTLGSRSPANAKESKHPERPECPEREDDVD